MCSAYCFSLRAVSVKVHAPLIVANIITNEKHVFKKIKDEASRMAINVIGFETLLGKITPKKLIKDKCCYFMMTVNICASTASAVAEV